MTLPDAASAPPPAPARSRGAGLGAVIVGAACALATGSPRTRRSAAPGRSLPDAWPARMDMGPESGTGEESRPRIRAANLVLPAGRAAGRGERAARRLAWGASALSFSILADSAAEHYRAGFHNRVMYAAPAARG